jgi:hypothetical protein
LRDFLPLREVELADTFCNFAADLVWADLVWVGADAWLLVWAETVPQARSTAQPALKHAVEMELPSLKMWSGSNFLLDRKQFPIEEAG